EQERSAWEPFGLYAVAVTTTLFALKHGYFSIPSLTKDLPILTDKHLLAPLRVIDFFGLAVLSSIILRRLGPNPIMRGLAYLGRHSLQVFSYHILLIHFVNLIAMPNIGSARQIAIAIICVMSLY